MPLYTIGFTGTTAEHFFDRLARAHVHTVLDTRLRTTGQLAGFAKVPDLPYFLRALHGIAYRHVAALAPTPELLDAYRARTLTWDQYADAYRALIVARDAAADPALGTLDGAALLCSEALASHCHRSIAAGVLRGTLDVVHL